MKRFVYFVVLVLGLSVLGLSANSCSCKKQVACAGCGRSINPDDPGVGIIYHNSDDLYCPECINKWEKEQDEKRNRELREKMFKGSRFE